MEKQWMELYTAELDVLEMAMRNFLLERITKKEREICERIIKAIDQKDEAWLVY
jgi:hypothetical protein